MGFLRTDILTASLHTIYFVTKCLFLAAHGQVTTGYLIKIIGSVRRTDFPKNIGILKNKIFHVIKSFES